MASLNIKPSYEIVQDGENFDVASHGPSGTHEVKFRMGDEFQEVLPITGDLYQVSFWLKTKPAKPVSLYGG